ncbi:beta strand repeat-containing protein, partial [Spirosoma horti]
VRATDANGCSGTSATYALVVSATNPTIAGLAATPNPACIGSAITFTATIGNVTGTYNYTLTNGSSTSIAGTSASTSFSQNLTAAGSGAQSFTLTVSANGQTSQATTSVTVTQPATATISYPGTVYCTNSSDATSPTLSGTSGGTYSSSPAGLSINSTTGQVVANTSQPGSYTVSYTLPAQGSCPTVVATAMLVITGPPTLVIINPTQPTCAVPTGTISVSAVGQGTIEYSKDGTTWQLSGIFNGLAPGNYTIQVRSQSATACTRSTIFTIDPVPTRTASISYPAGPYCQNASTTYAPTRSGIPAGTFSSSPVGLSINSGGTVFPSLSQPGSYTVSYTVPAQGDCPTVVATASLTIVAAPTYVFGGGFPGTTQPTCGSPTGTISLSATGTGTVEYSRDNGANWQASGTFANLPPNQLYTILARSVANPGCTRSLSLSINAVPSPPVASILAPASTTLSCASPSLSLTATGGGSYRWEDNTTAAVRTITTAGIYSVTVSNGATGCFSTTSATVSSTTATVTVAAPSMSNVTVGTAFSQTFTSSSSGTSPRTYSLTSGSLPDGLSLNATTGVLSGTPTQSGNYSIRVRATDANGCSGLSAPYTLVINQAASTLTGFSASSNSVCVGSPVTFTATVGNVTGTYNYTLTNGSNPLTGSTTNTAFSQLLTASGTGPQVFTLTVSNNGQISQATASLTVNSLPTLELSAANVCAGQALSLSATSGLSSYTFTGASGVIAGSGNTRSAEGLAAGTYSFSVAGANANGCLNTDVVSVTVNALPEATLVSSGTLSCAQTSVTLTAGVGSGYSYTFTGPDGTVLGPSDASPTRVVSSPGSYSVRVGNLSGCVSTASTTVNQSVALPTVSISPSSTTLSSATPTASLTANGTGNFRWSTGETTQVISVSATGTYSVTLTTGSCSATATTSVEFIGGGDLTPILSLPQGNFAASGPESIHNLTMTIAEQAGKATNGVIVLTLTPPLGYSLSFDPTLTSINVTGGTTNPVGVNNAMWEVRASNSLQLTLASKPGQRIGARGESVIGLSLSRSPVASAGTANLTVNVNDDPTGQYDANPTNNIYARILNSL